MKDKCFVNNKDDGLVQWFVDRETLTGLYPLLYKDVETGGKFTFERDTVGRTIRRTSLKVYKKDGKSDSVQAPEAILNFHTHPVSCYLSENTIYGWPSSEDLRETIIFSLKGSVGHVVITIEGVYVIQVNPCIINQLIYLNIPNIDKYCDIFLSIYKEMCKANKYKDNVLYIKNKRSLNPKDGSREMIRDIVRGIIVLFLEIYFRATHRFRLSDINYGNRYSPENFIQFVNSFKLENLFSTREIVGCETSTIRCHGVPIHDKNDLEKSKQKNFKEYILEYEGDTNIYLVDSRGETFSLNYPVKKILKIIPFIQEIILNKCPHEEKKKTDFRWGENWFNISLEPNHILLGGGRFRSYLDPEITLEEKKSFLQNAQDGVIKLGPTEPSFWYYNMDGDCDHSHIQRFSRHRKFSSPPKIKEYLVIGTDVCRFCTKLINNFDTNKISYTKNFYENVSEAVDAANKVGDKKDIKSVPAVFLNGTYIPNPNALYE